MYSVFCSGPDQESIVYHVDKTNTKANDIGTLKRYSNKQV